MTKRRSPIRFDELDPPKGRSSILRSRAEVLAEQEATGLPESRTSGNPDGLTSREGVDRTAFMKATYRICPEAVEAIDEIKRRLRGHLGRRITYEEIAEASLVAALDDLTKNRDSSFLVRWISGDPGIRKSAEPERPSD